MKFTGTNNEILQLSEVDGNSCHELTEVVPTALSILCTRFYREQHQMGDTDRSQVDLIRSFNYLVEQHFKTLHTVADYAELMHKSPKTLSNLFSKVGGKTPLQYIQERKMLEARRWLHHTDKSIKEVAYDLGFEDLQSFSRFFKKHQGVSPTQFKASA